jgi:hypothetical protein
MKSFSVNSLLFSKLILVSPSLNMYLLSFSDCKRRFSKFLVNVFMFACSASIDSIIQNKHNFNQILMK